MKFKDTQIKGKSSVTIQLFRGEESYPLVITAHSKDLNVIWKKRGLTIPEVPRKAQKDSKGSWIKDSITGEIALLPDDKDAEYQRRVEVFVNRSAALHVYDALRNCDDISFSVSVPPDNASNEEYMAFLDALHEEVYDAESGFTRKEGRQIQEIAERLDGRIEVEGKLSDFLSKVLEG